MSKRLAALRDQYAATTDRMEAILDASAEREMSAEEQVDYDALEKERTALASRIDREEKFLTMQASNGRVIRSLAGDGSDEETGAGARGAAAKKTQIGAIRDNQLDDPRKGFATHREFLMCVMSAGMGRRPDPRLRALYQEPMASAGSDEQQTQDEGHGGYLTPEAFLPEFLQIEPEPDPLTRTTNVPMQAPVVKIPSRVDKNHTTSVSGGLTVSRREETGTINSSRMETEQIRLEASSLFGLAYASEEILTDSPLSFAALLQQGFNQEFQNHMIDEKLNGTGVGQYLGIMGSGALIVVDEEDGQAADTIVIQNVLNMRSRCWRYGQAVWVANHDTLPQIATLCLPNTSGPSAVLVFMPSSREDVPDLLLGRPIIFTEYTQTIGAQGDLVLANMTQYLEGTYQPLQSAESIHVRFLNHERSFKFWTRNAGSPWWKAALTPRHSSNTLSPFVTIAERSGS